MFFDFCCVEALCGFCTCFTFITCFDFCLATLRNAFSLSLTPQKSPTQIDSPPKVDSSSATTGNVTKLLRRANDFSIFVNLKFSLLLIALHLFGFPRVTFRVFFFCVCMCTRTPTQMDLPLKRSPLRRRPMVVPAVKHRRRRRRQNRRHQSPSRSECWLRWVGRPVKVRSFFFVCVYVCSLKLALFSHINRFHPGNSR